MWSKHTVNKACYCQMVIQFFINVHFVFTRYQVSQELRDFFVSLLDICRQKHNYVVYLNN